MSNSSLQVTEQNGDLVVDSRLIAMRLGIEHRAFMQTLKRYQDKIEARFGVITFEMSKPLEGGQAGRPEKYALLTEDQATTLMIFSKTFSKNTDDVVDCKLDLVAAFSEAKQIIKFDKAISDPESQITELKAKYPESQITELKAKYPEFVEQKPTEIVITEKPNKFKGVVKRHGKYRAQMHDSKTGKHIWTKSYLTPELAARALDLATVRIRGEGCKTNFAVEGIHTKVLFPDYPATKRHEAFDLSPKLIKPIKEPIQLNMVTLDHATDDSQGETIYDRMRAFAAENGIEIKTMKSA